MQRAALVAILLFCTRLFAHDVLVPASVLVQGFPRVSVAPGDQEYLAVDLPKWDARAYMEWLKKNGVVKYTDKFDCDKFADACRVWANFQHNKKGLRGYSYCIGVLFYVKDVDGRGHAINFIITLDGRRVYFDPQACEGKKFVPAILTDAEVASIYHVHI